MRTARSILFASVIAAFAIGASPTVKAEIRLAPPPAFAQCAACHATTPGRTSFGPNLVGVGGRRAARVAGYAYSEPLRKAGITWDAATLDRWLTSPQRTVPGTRMPFGGMADRAARKAVIDYLMTLKP